MNTFAIATLGCKVNAYESQGYEQALQESKYREVSFKEVADIYIINTCAVTNTAASKSRQKIHQAQALNEKALIVVVGCYVQTASEQLMKDLRIDVLIGSDQKDQLPSLIEESLNDRIQRNVVRDVRRASVFESMQVDHFSHQTRAYLKIQDGCNQFCSYCIIPYARGNERSLHPDKVIQAAKELCNHGHLEIVLSGIHTGRYGKEHGISLCGLLKCMCDEVECLKRIRISSIEINELSDELLTFMAQEEKIARHLHIPIQCANDDILSLMNRPYTMKEFTKRIEEIRSILPGISISSDVIVGFPSESEEQFVDTLENIKNLKFSFLHVFPYSKRDGTNAASLSGHLDHKIKKERTKRLMTLSKELYREYKAKLINKEVEVLWEKEVDGKYFGHSSEYVEVCSVQKDTKLHELQKVVITSFDGDILLCVHREVML